MHKLSNSPQLSQKIFEFDPQDVIIKPYEMFSKILFRPQEQVFKNQYPFLHVGMLSVVKEQALTG